MAALSKNRKTSERVPELRQFEAGAKIYAGALVALNTTGKAVPASDTAGLTVVGRAEITAESGKMVTVKTGCFLYENSTGAAVTAAEVGKVCYVADDQTVAKTGGTNSIVAGLVYYIDKKGVWVLVGTQPISITVQQAAG